MTGETYQFHFLRKKNYRTLTAISDEALESRFSGKSPMNFHNTPPSAPLPEIKKAV